MIYGKQNRETFFLFQLIGSFAHVSKSCHLLIERSCTTILTDLGLAVNAVVGVNLEKNEKMQIRYDWFFIRFVIGNRFGMAYIRNDKFIKHFGFFCTLFFTMKEISPNFSYQLIL